MKDIAVVHFWCYTEKKEKERYEGNMGYSNTMSHIEEMIVFEDSDLIVCRKPAGFPVQSKRLGSMDMESALKTYLVQKGNPPYLAVVHRLDQPVQGLLVFAKNQASAGNLSRQVQQGKFEKRYLTYVKGHPKKKEDCLVDELEKDSRTNCSRVVEHKTPRSKQAKLYYKTITETQEGSLLEIKLETGRHHQIRVQLAHAGMPIFGDAKYNLHIEEKERQESISLCAYKLSFFHPRTKKKMEFQTKPVGNFPIV